ncbi:hypothetical protein AB4114_18305 [Paenibacillus sp. 2RAB27]|uniref:hypothetical protein n=1 Tax=Paenibacillus sp. 2RAB27 TaxID=3232991 RepID=UPI003F9BBEB1
MKNIQQAMAGYEEGCNTIRKVPENYCLIAFREDDGPIFDVDAATIPHRDRIVGVFEKWLKSDGQSKDILSAKVSQELAKYYRLIDSFACKFMADHCNDFPLTDNTLEEAFNHCVLPVHSSFIRTT